MTRPCDRWCPFTGCDSCPWPGGWVCEARRLAATNYHNPTDTRRKPPTGHCHDCDKPVTGERRLCGLCAARRDR